jgi:hypothetical protein
MVALENRPWSPFYQRGILPQSEKRPLFEKEGAGGDFRRESWTLNY